MKIIICVYVHCNLEARSYFVLCIWYICFLEGTLVLCELVWIDNIDTEYSSLSFLAKALAIREKHFLASIPISYHWSKRLKGCKLYFLHVAHVCCYVFFSSFHWFLAGVFCFHTVSRLDQKSFRQKILFDIFSKNL